MTWLPLLLADPSPCLRWLVLHDLYHRQPDDPELVELAPLRLADPLITDILALQNKDGSWTAGSLAIGRAGGSPVQMTAFALARLGYTGCDHSLPAVAHAAEFLFSHQQADGSWPLVESFSLTDGSQELPIHERYSLIPLQTAIPLRGLAACGYAEDPRCERAYDWLLAQCLPDGAWPTGLAAGVYGSVGGYRRLPHSRWGCRSNTTGALICLAFHPQRCTSEPARRALDLLLGRETREAYALGVEVARLVGAELPRGLLTYFARFDLALLLDLCSRIGVSPDDERLTSLVEFIRSRQGQYGLWEVAGHPQVSRWLTFDLLRSLDRLPEDSWTGQEPRTPFRAYL